MTRVSNINNHIPDLPSKPAINPLHARLLLYGSSGSGRSTFASKFPSVYFDLSGTAQYLDIRRYPIEIPQGWRPGGKRRLSLWSWIVEGVESCIRDRPAETLVIDTLDRAFEICFESVCESHGVSEPQENMRKMRQIYGSINREFMTFLSRLSLYPGGVIIIAGEECVHRTASGTIVDSDDPDRVSSRWEPSFKAKSATKHKLRSKLEEICGIICRAHAMGGTPSLAFGDPGSLTKDRTGLLPVASIPMNYSAFCEPFAKAYKKPEADGQ